MKKLALALVCLVSVAFFASCDPEGQPSIAVLQEEGYVESGTTVNVNEEINFGFVCASSPMTLKDLSTLVVNVENFDVEGTSLNSMEYARKDLTGMTEYTYKDVITYNLSKDEIVGTSVITATVTDIDGQAATATITLNINQPELPLFVKPIEWIRKGATVLSAEEMETYGLQWTGTYKAPFATIKPIDGATLYVCNGDDFEGITTLAEKATYFTNLAETAEAVPSYRNIDANQSANYNDMLAVVNGENCYVILVKHAKIETITGVGTQITITGEAK